MLIRAHRARRLVAFCVGWFLVASVIGLAPLAVGAVHPTTANAAPLDCAPVGVEWIENQLYYVENCFGYDVYRLL